MTTENTEGTEKGDREAERVQGKAKVACYRPANHFEDRRETKEMNWLEKLPKDLSYEIPKATLEAIAEGRIAVSDDYFRDLKKADSKVRGRIPESIEGLEWNQDFILDNRVIAGESPPDVDSWNWVHWMILTPTFP